MRWNGGLGGAGKAIPGSDLRKKGASPKYPLIASLGISLQVGVGVGEVLFGPHLQQYCTLQTTVGREIFAVNEFSRFWSDREIKLRKI